MKNAKIILALVLTLFCGSSIAATITWSSPVTNVGVNDTFTINVIGTGFTSNVDGGGVNISFDQNILNVLSVSINETVWDFGGFGISTGTIDNAAGKVDGIMVNTFANVIGDFTVASIEVQAISVGNSLLSLATYGLNPWASNGGLINPDFNDATVNVSAVTAVPVPMAFWLFGSGLIGLVAVARRKASS